MGMTISEAISKLRYELNKNNKMANAYAVAIDTMRKYQLMQADYENRLKADMVAILEDFDLQIDEFDSGCGWDGYIKKIDVHEIIQQKINALKGE